MNEIAKERLTLLFKNPKCPAWFANDDHLKRTVEYLVSNGVVANSITRRIMTDKR